MKSMKQLNVRYFLPAALLLGSFMAAYFPVWKRLVMTWSGSDEYSHGFFIVPICIYIIFRKKDDLENVKIHSSVFGLFLVLFALLLYVLGHYAEIITLASLSMIILIGGSVMYLYGMPMLRILIFPLFILLFMIPIPGQIYSATTIPLQLFVSKVSVWLAAGLGLPIFREGNVIHLPDQTMQVVQACSGLRSMTALLTLSAVFGYLTLKSNYLRGIIFVAGIPVAILVNIIRVLILILAFYYFNYDLTKGTVHTIFGMVIFVFALLSIAIIKEVLSKWEIQTTKE